MPDFTYHAVDQAGRSADGTMTADSEHALEQRLREIGYWLIEAKEQTVRRDTRISSVPRRELIDFFSGMASLMDAGIPMAEAISAMAEETAHTSLRAVLEDVSVNVQAGQDLSTSFEKYPKVFPGQLCKLVRAGEYGGNLVETFGDLTAHLEWTDQIVADIRQASVYPSVILAAVAGLIALMFVVVVPKFATIFSELELELPALTRAVVGIGDIARAYWWLVAACGIGLYVGMGMARRRSRRLDLLIDRLRLRLPVFGRIISLLVQSQFVHNLGLMLKAGVPIMDALRLTQGLSNNRVMDEAIADAENQVRSGGRISDALREHSVVSSLTLRMIVVGEDAGKLDESLLQISRRFDAEIPRQIKRVFAILEPAITLMLVGIVGLVAASIFLPMFALATGIG